MRLSIKFTFRMFYSFLFLNIASCYGNYERSFYVKFRFSRSELSFPHRDRLHIHLLPQRDHGILPRRWRFEATELSGRSWHVSGSDGRFYHRKRPRSLLIESVLHRGRGVGVVRQRHEWKRVSECGANSELVRDRSDASAVGHSRVNGYFCCIDTN